MSRLNQPENYLGRVNYAASVIIRGALPTRAFDNCFENYDGDAVSAALARRAGRNERLAKNLPRYIDEARAYGLATQWNGQNLTAIAKELRQAKSAGGIA